MEVNIEEIESKLKPIYVVYRHIRLDKNEPFYIGIGKETRPYEFPSNRGNFWEKIYNKSKKKIKVDILLEELTWKQACEKEIEFIALYGRKDKCLGSLCNLTDGEDGCPGTIVSKETVEKRKKTWEENGTWLKPPTPEISKRRSESAKKQRKNETLEERENINKKTKNTKIKNGTWRQSNTKESKEKQKQTRIKNGTYCQPQTEESKKKQSLKMLGKKDSEETKLKKSNSHKGLKTSEETKKKQSAASKKRFQERPESFSESFTSGIVSEESKKIISEKVS